jgi:hypothetical protein
LSVIEITHCQKGGYHESEQEYFNPGAGAEYFFYSGNNHFSRFSWKSLEKVTEPIVETIMISTRTQQGISFTSRGQAIQEVSP